MDLGTFVRIFLHIAPALPFFWGRYLLGVILALLVLLFYIKTLKLSQQIAHLKSTTADQKEDQLASLEKARNFWQALTFIQTK